MVAARDLPATRTLADNVLDALSRATSEDWRYGSTWYVEARAYATHLADEYGVSPETAAAVIAVLSPRMDWDDNKRVARRALADWNAGQTITGALSNSCTRAARNLADPTLADVRRQSRTLKVHSFWRNICGDESCATIDRHATRTALGDHYLSEDRVALASDAAYRAISDAYVLAAEDAELPTSMLQAIVWSVCRRERGEAQRTKTHTAL